MQLRLSVRAYALALIIPAPAPAPHKHLTGNFAPAPAPSTNLTGTSSNLTGTLPRNLSGNLSGSLTGHLTGNLPRNLSGSLTGHNPGTIPMNPVNSTPPISQIPIPISNQISSQNLPDFGRFETEEELLAFMSAYSDRYTTGPTPSSTPTSNYASTPATPALPTPTGTAKIYAFKSSENLTGKSGLVSSLFNDKQNSGSLCVYELVRSVGSVGVGGAAEGDDLALTVYVMMDFDNQVQPLKKLHQLNS